MPKFLKGVYAVTIEEFDELLSKYNNKEFITIKDRQYLPLYVKRKSEDIEQNEFESVVDKYTRKKDLYEALGSTYFKLEKFCMETYKTSDLDEIRTIIRNRNL